MVLRYVDSGLKHILVFSLLGDSSMVGYIKVCVLICNSLIELVLGVAWS